MDTWGGRLEGLNAQGILESPHHLYCFMQFGGEEILEILSA